MVAPCKDCEKRELGCHGKCEEYKAFALERDTINRLKYKDKASRWMTTKWVEMNLKKRMRRQ